MPGKPGVPGGFTEPRCFESSISNLEPDWIYLDKSFLAVYDLDAMSKVSR